MEVDRNDLNLRFASYVNMLSRHLADEFAVTTHQLDDQYTDHLAPLRKFEADVPGLKDKLDVFEAIPQVTSLDSREEEAKVRFVRALQIATSADAGSRDIHLNRLVSMFTVRRGSWFISLFTDSLPAVKLNPIYGVRDDIVATAK
ncbi:MAG: hypothetical protein WC813_00095 [Patescibacteria group bacterium]|jgi:hypothetical protein